MGVCGADPIAVARRREPAWSEADEDELNTLRRLGFADNTRMACCARLQSGTVTVEIYARARKRRGSGEPTRQFDRSIVSVVVLGNGIAGVTAADFVRRGHPDCEIHLVGARVARAVQPHGHLAAGLRPLRDDRALPAGRGVVRRAPESRPGSTRVATSIDLASRRVVTRHRRDSLYYDRLILATGQQQRVRRSPGFGAPGTFVMRSAGDAMEIRAVRPDARRPRRRGRGRRPARPRGGVRAALARSAGGRARTRRAADVPAARRARQRPGGRALPPDRHDRALPAESASLQVEDRGAIGDAHRRPGGALRRVPGGGAASGPTPRSPRRAGIACNKGIRGRRQDAVAVPGVFAAGDVAEHGGLVLGLWPIAAKQGEAAAVNALGGDQRLVAEIPATILKGVDLELSSIGQVEPGPGDDVIVLERAHSYRRLVVSRGTLVGAIADRPSPRGPAPRRPPPCASGSSLTPGRCPNCGRGAGTCCAQGRNPVGASRYGVGTPGCPADAVRTVAATDCRCGRTVDVGRSRPADSARSRPSMRCGLADCQCDPVGPGSAPDG